MVSSTYDRLNLNPTTVNATMVTSIVSYLRDPSLDLHAVMHAHTDAYCVPLGHDVTSAVLAASGAQPTPLRPRSIQPATPRGPGLTLVPRTGTDPPSTDHIVALSTSTPPSLSPFFRSFLCFNGAPRHTAAPHGASQICILCW